MNKNEVILHGEAMIFRSSIPKTAKRKDLREEKFIIIAESETTGNHHVIDNLNGVEFYEDGQKLYMNSKVTTKVRCVLPERHDAIEIPPGTYEFGTQQEYDPFTARMQKVAD